MNSSTLIEFAPPARVVGPQSPRMRRVAQLFGLGIPRPSPAHFAALRLPSPAPGQIILISGPSGSGKSTLLRQCRRQCGKAGWLDLAALRLRPRAVVDLFPSLSVENTLELLSRFGLAEAHTYLLRPGELSDGQRWRLRLAMALHRASRRKQTCVACDEFAAMLDDVTARIVARRLRRIVEPSSGMSAVLATCRNDLTDALRPDVVVNCDFGRVVVRNLATDSLSQ